MFLRYRLVVSYFETVIYEKYFKSINQVVNVADGFDDDSVFECHDLLTDTLFSNVFLRGLIKEFRR